MARVSYRRTNEQMKAAGAFAPHAPYKKNGGQKQYSIIDSTDKYKILVIV